MHVLLPSVIVAVQSIYIRKDNTDKFLSLLLNFPPMGPTTAPKYPLVPDKGTESTIIYTVLPPIGRLIRLGNISTNFIGRLPI